MLYFGIFAAFSVGSLALLRAALGTWQPGQRRIRRRLAGEFDGGAAPAAAAGLYKNVAQWDADLGDAAPGSEAETAAAVPGWRPRLEEFLLQAGVPLTVPALAKLVAAAAATFAAVGLVFAGPGAGAAGLALGVVGPAILLSAKRKARRERYVKQLVGAFELMARVLRSGQSVPEAFRGAANAGDEPLRGEFARCLHQIEHGLRPEAAYRDLSQRAGVVELRIFVVAMTIQKQSGGNLSEVLDRLAAVVRGRLLQKQKLRALTAEGRLQSLTLLVLPPVTFCAMYVLNQPYAEQLLAQPKLLLGTAGLMGVGVVWIRNIMNFEG